MCRHSEHHGFMTTSPTEKILSRVREAGVLRPRDLEDAGNLRNRSFWPLLGRVGLPRIRFHDLRHTAATLMLGRGVHPKVVSEMLGHSQISITLDLYSHVTPTMQAAAVAEMESLLARR